MKKITYLSSVVVLTAAIGFGVTAPVDAGEHTVVAQTHSDDSANRRSGCRHPDRSKCRRPIHKQAQEEEQPSVEARPKKTRRCLKGTQPHRSPRRC